MGCKTCSGRRVVQCPACKNKRYNYIDCERCSTKGFELKRQVCKSCEGSGTVIEGANKNSATRIGKSKK